MRRIGVKDLFLIDYLILEMEAEERGSFNFTGSTTFSCIINSLLFYILPKEGL